MYDSNLRNSWLDGAHPCGERSFVIHGVNEQQRRPSLATSSWLHAGQPQADDGAAVEGDGCEKLVASRACARKERVNGLPREVLGEQLPFGAHVEDTWGLDDFEEWETERRIDRQRRWGKRLPRGRGGADQVVI